MTQSRGFNNLEVVNKTTNKAKDLSNKKSLNEVTKTTDFARKTLPYPTKFGMGIKNEIKDIMKVIKSLENKVILLKGTTTKVTSQEGGF